jgi:pimeloyl-ACP methyl ester carboxylesterase
MMSLINCLHEDENYKFKQPVLLLCGADDKSGNIKESMTLWSQSDNSCQLFIIDNARHNSNQDNPNIVNMEINKFVSK